MPFNNSGTLIVRTYAASGALPVAGTVVRIFGADEENRFIEYSVITNIDGNTDRVSLPAPSNIFSQTPNPNDSAYALYNIEITAPGYYTKKIRNVSVFDGTETVQLVNMIPININNTNSKEPINNLNTDAQANTEIQQTI